MEDAKRQITEAHELTDQLPLTAAQEHLAAVASGQLQGLLQDAITIVEALKEAVPALERDMRTIYDDSRKAEELLTAAADTDVDMFFITNANHDLSHSAARGQQLTFNLLHCLHRTLSALNEAETATANYKRNTDVIGQHIADAVVARKTALEQTDDYLKDLDT